MIISKRIILDFFKSSNKDFTQYLIAKGYTGVCVLPKDEIIFGAYTLDSEEVREILNLHNVICSLAGNKTNYIPFSILPIYKKKLFRQVFERYSINVNGREQMLSDIHSFAVEL